jgi:hypothetical protein
MTAKRVAKKAPAKKAPPAPKAAAAPAQSPTVPADADADEQLTPADRAERRTDLTADVAAQARADRRTGPARCAMGFVIWDGVTGLCRRCIIAKRDTCAGAE